MWSGGERMPQQFLGGLAGAIPPGYPADDSDIISLPNQIGAAGVATPSPQPTDHRG
jgi:hypothetical protein